MMVADQRDYAPPRPEWKETDPRPRDLLTVLLARKLGVGVDSVELERFVLENFHTLSNLAHAIHRGREL